MGIMNFTKTAFKNLFHKPATGGYPDVPKAYPTRYRGKVEINIDDCIMCGMCMRKCPAGAITVDRDKKTWTIERMSCVQCSYCVNVCPKKCLSMEQQYSKPDTVKTQDTYSQPIPEAAAESTAGKKPAADMSACVFCTLCAKNCPVGAITVDRAEKKWELSGETCVSCGLCATKCPKKCIEMK